MPYKLPTKTLRLWQIRALLLDLIVLVICLYFHISIGWFLQIYCLFTSFFLLLIFWYLPKYIKAYSIRISGDSVIIESGVFIKTTHIMPELKMIYTQTFTSPIAKRFNITAISLKAARSRIFIPEMKETDVKSILSLLSKEENNEKRI